MFTIYVITCLTPNHFYIGYTKDFEHRIERHRSGNGARFTKKHGVKSVMIVTKADNLQRAKKVEFSTTLIMKKRPGLVVCGAGWSETNQPVNK